MLTLGQGDVSIDPVTATARRREEENGGRGWLVFSLMMPVLTAFVGYAIGFERGTKKG